MPCQQSCSLIWPFFLARSIKYQLTIAKLPLAKDLTEFEFKGTRLSFRTASTRS